MADFLYYNIEQQNVPELLNNTSSAGPLIYFGETYEGGIDSLTDKSITRRLFIVKNPGICQGQPTILGTRISVVNIVEFRYILDWNFQKIKDEYPALNDEQINAALEYYDENKNEIDKYLQEDRAIDET